MCVLVVGCTHKGVRVWAAFHNSTVFVSSDSQTCCMWHAFRHTGVGTQRCLCLLAAGVPACVPLAPNGGQVGLPHAQAPTGTLQAAGKQDNVQWLSAACHHWQSCCTKQALP
jgi:hypothetical protein